jgi:hypothetical protein
VEWHQGERDNFCHTQKGIYFLGESIFLQHTVLVDLAAKPR